MGLIAGVVPRLLRTSASTSAAVAKDVRRHVNRASTGHTGATGDATRAVIRELRQLTPTTRGLVLEMLDSTGFNFVAGQWVDMFIPGIEAVGGYSIVSAPCQLPLLELAIKASRHPAAAWVTEEASVGSVVALRVGGSFVLPMPRPPRNLFIAGGVGLTPLYAMIHQLASEDADHQVALIHTTGKSSELLFREELQALAMANPDRVRVDSLTTKEGATADRRIDRPLIAEAIKWLGGAEDVVVYVCGPKGMPEAMVELCASCGIPPRDVRYEKWW